MSTPSISVIIQTYNRRHVLEEIVGAVTRDPYPREIVVVVDGSTDGSMELLERLAADEPRLVPVWQENRGQSAARWAGIQRATGDLLLLLDDDVLAGPGLAAGHARVHARVERAVVLGYMPTRAPSPRRPGDYTTLLYGEDYERACAAYEADPSLVVTQLWAGNMSLHRVDALAAGEDPELERHVDRAFGLRLARAGLTGVFDRSLRATHLHTQSPAAFVRQFHQQGRARHRLATMFPEYVTAVDPLTEVPGFVKLFLPVPGLLKSAVRVAGAAHAWGLETAGARVLRQVELGRGFRAAAAQPAK
ncbi:glycosyltransferase family 2 protein [Dactylosporangium vinaceum]|uniref:Glycosyltransferase family 2 protein n=1 Tax=Dactylosporangium vinaceum TaxID=53362 RepID=A0ABV5MN73_9ACTN|nr:glycosyltransferase family 2 protein [Dactylosporangium vinaceum]UAB97711.1 glycosyltransferase family 2 protein [Dactylosporangium vinaceum]